MPMARATSRRLSEFAYELRMRRPDYKAVVVLTVLGGVPDIADVVVRVEYASLRFGAFVAEELLCSRT